MLAPLTIADADIHINFRPALLEKLVGSLNSLPATSRVVTFGSVAGGAAKAWRGWTRCFARGPAVSFVELNGNDGISNGHFELGQFATHFSNSMFTLSTTYYLRARASWHWHVDACIGGGVGGIIGTEAESRGTLVAILQVEQLTDGRLALKVSSSSPDKLGATISAGFGRLGHQSFRLEVDNPLKTPLILALANSFLSKGWAEVPGGKRREYVVTMEGVQPKISSLGITTSARVRVNWTGN